MRTLALIATAYGEPTDDMLEGLERDRILGPDGERYLDRYHLTDSVRLHHIMSDDAQDDMHDHPWDLTSVLVTGGYREVTPAGELEHWAPSVIVRQAEEPHRLELLAGPMWTIAITGPVRRRWGFHTPAGWVHWRDYPRAGRYARALDDEVDALTYRNVMRARARPPAPARRW